MTARRTGVLTISDRASRGEYDDACGPLITVMIQQELGWEVVLTDIVPDERDVISDTLRTWSDSENLSLVVTTGGTGFSPRDVTPEATGDVIDRLAPGLAEGMRAESLKITPHAMLSRGICGIRGQTLIVNLPGSPKAVRENLAFIIPVLPHAVDLITGDPGSEAGHTKTPES